MSDARLRQLERAHAAAPSLATLQALDVERRRAGDGPWLPALVYADPFAEAAALRARIEAGLVSMFELGWRRGFSVELVTPTPARGTPEWLEVDRHLEAAMREAVRTKFAQLGIGFPWIDPMAEARAEHTLLASGIRPPRGGD